MAPRPPFLGLPPFSQQPTAKLSTFWTLSQPPFCLCVVRALEVGLLQRPGALLRELHAAEEGLEAGVVAQGIVCRFNFQVDQVAGVVFKCFFQPVESFFLLAQLDVV